MKSGTVAAHDFSKVPSISVPRSKFKRSSSNKLTLNSGDLVPVFLDDVLPGDTHTLNISLFGRLTTPIKPLMDNLYIAWFAFYSPMRLLWDDTAHFFGEKDNPDDDTDYEIPQITIPGDLESMTLADFFGMPIGVGDDFKVSALPYRMYNLVYDQWFRDQNLQDRPAINKGAGPDDLDDYPLRKRGKRHDYFTSALTSPQKGPDVLLPLGGSAPIEMSGGLLEAETEWWLGSAPAAEPIKAIAPTGAWNSDSFIQVVGDGGSENNKALGMHVGITDDVIEAQLTANLADATAIPVNTLREAEAVQVYYERAMRSGTRYIEWIRGQFGVISPDARLQRTEYLGGGVSRANFHPVAQTTQTDSPTAKDGLGNLAAFTTLSVEDHGFSKAFVEHGYIMVLVCIYADLHYQQGVERHWTKKTPLEFYVPALANLGEQVVYNGEIFKQGDTVVDGDGNVIDKKAFGYQERWAEYRYKPSRICGKMRSTDPESLDYWHLAQEFDGLPELGDDFIKENPPVSRIIAVENEPEFYLDCFFDHISARAMPMYSIPGLGVRL